jgi:hypothetical protein
MKAKYGGPMTIDDLFQALWQDREFFQSHSITHVKSGFLYFTLCDIHGDPATVGDGADNIIDGFRSAGAYHSAADEYDAGTLEPQVMTLCG